MAQVIKDIKTWLMQWFYTESEVDTITGGLQTQINNKADTSTVSALTTTVNGKADKTNGASQITDGNANTYTNISSSLTSSSTQAQINSAINTAIGNLVGIDFIVVVSTLPTASASTMGKLYLVAISGGSGENNFAEYVTVHQNSTYSWEKLGEISGSGLSVDWSDITGKPSSFTPSSHTHGQITNDGKITSSAVTVASGDNIVITDADDSSKVKRVANLLTSHIKDATAHSNIGSSANATQSTINTAIDTALSNKANTSSLPSNTSELNNDGSSGNYPYVETSDLEYYIEKSNTSGLVKNDGTIDTTTYVSDVSGKSDKTATIGTTITLVNAGETNEGCIIFNTIS